MAQRLTAEELNKRIERLATLDPSALNTVAKLRAELYGAGITAVQRGKTSVPVSAAKKSELLAALGTFVQKQKAVNEILPELNTLTVADVDEIRASLNTQVSDGLGDFAQWFYEQLVKLNAARWDIEHSVWKLPGGDFADLAFHVVRYLNKRHPDEEDTNRATTRLRSRTHIKNGVRQMIEANHANQQEYAELLKDFERVFRFAQDAMKTDSKHKSEADDSQRVKRGHSTPAISIDPLLDKAFSVLDKLTDNTPASAWKDVTIALMLGTGRRAFSEILSKAEFAYVSPHLVSFTGQAKTKGETDSFYTENPSYIIPTLIPAQLVVKGVEWLKEQGKRADDEATAHNRYSSDLSKHIKSMAWCGSLLPRMVEDKKANAHRFRELYALAATHVFSDGTCHSSNFVSYLLGHGRGKEDNTTALRYQVDYSLERTSKGVVGDVKTEDVQRLMQEFQNLVQNRRTV